MIIHCLSCGKCISSQGKNCPYCLAQITDITMELNGMQTDKSNFKEKMRELVLGIVYK
jgi:RNA polymerase subunit RPABC4/transcription elongation factor Spt4